MKFGKYIHSNKGFFLLALLAAILGTVASFFFGGCTKAEEQQTRVIASKRVTIDVQQETVPDEVVVASIERDKPHETPAVKKIEVKKKSAAKAVKKAPAKKAPRAVVKQKRPQQKKKALKTITNSWAINVASFKNLPEAKRLKKRLTNSGRSAYITEFTKGNTLYYRVRVGFFASRSSASREGRAISSEFKNTGSAWVVQPGMSEIVTHSK
ncbi:MAG: SPOR domain-containing protein [Thermodesulfobacteriota bacterium]